MDVYITRTIDTPYKVQEKVSEIPEPSSMPSDLSSYNYPLWIVIKNKTQFTINSDGTPYFDYGSLHGEASSVSAYSVTAFGAKNNHWYTGTGGGLRFVMSLDEKNSFTFVIGFENPVTSKEKAHVEESSDAENDGYKKNTLNGNNIVSKSIYRGTSKNGSPLSFKLHLSAVAGKTTTVTIVQDVLESK